MSSESPKPFETVAAQLIEAALSAFRGDVEAVNDRLARARSLLRQEVWSAPMVVRDADQSLRRGGLTAWQARRVVEHMDANIAKRIRIGDLAPLVELSKGHFGREFKRSFGMTVHAYLMLRRIEVSQGLMVSTRSPLSEIALKCGMSDQSHFSRAFRRVIGQTPDAWRRSRLQVLDGSDIEASTARGNGG